MLEFLYSTLSYTSSPAPPQSAAADEQPTIHEGVAARIVEKKGGVSERCEINRQIRADNKLLRELKALVKKLAESAREAVTALARKLETIRANMILYGNLACRIFQNMRE